MTSSYTYDGGALTNIRRGSVSVTQSAENGSIGRGQLVVNDPAGTLEIVGQKDFSIGEDACAFPLVFRGFVADRQHRRGPESVGPAREVEIVLEDLNSMTGFRLIDDDDGDRPRETVDERLTWLLGSDYVSGLFTGTRVTTVTTEMDKSDYRHQYPGDVIEDCALAAGGFNHHVNDWGSGPDLTFRDDNASTADSSTLRISNVIADKDADTLYPFKDAVLTRSPARVISKIAYSYAKDTIVRSRPATATAYNGERGGSASNSNIKTSSMAARAANNRLSQLRTEEDVIRCTVLVTSAQVNLILPGQRIQAKFSHLGNTGGRDYDEFTWFRIIELTKSSLLKPVSKYRLDLVLSPQEAADDTPVCNADPTPADTYFPLGGADDFANAVGTNIAYYIRAGLTEPYAGPNPDFIGRWHFPTWGYGGVSDTFASGFGNSLQFLLVGNGTLTIQTVKWEGQNQPFGITVVHVNGDGSTDEVFQDLTAGIAGDSYEVEITTGDDPECMNVVRLTADERLDGSYIGMGWSSAEWVPA